MLQLQLNKSTILADSAILDHRRKTEPKETLVKVGRIGLSPRNLIGNAQSAINRAFKIKVGEEVIDPGTSLGSTTTKTDTSTIVTEDKPGVKTTLLTTGEKVFGTVLLASMIAGPPLAGYYIFGKWGAIVGGVVAAPLVLVGGVIMWYAWTDNSGQYK